MSASSVVIPPASISHSLAELRKAEIRSKRALRVDSVGQYRSALRGSGLIFSDLREYEPGDDVRHIHWPASVRTPKVYVKRYQEDRSLSLFFLLDVSPSMGAPVSRARRAVEVLLLLSLLAERNGDRVGLSLFSERVESFLPVGRVRHPSRQLVDLLSRPRPSELRLPDGREARGLEVALDLFIRTHRRPAVVFLVSDLFLSLSDELLSRAAFQHDLVVVFASDPWDAGDGPRELIGYSDPETGAMQTVDFRSARARQAVRERCLEHERRWKSRCEKVRADFFTIRSEASGPLRAWMSERSRRR